MQLDPRTVSRRHLLERAGFKRPDLSVVLPAVEASTNVLEQFDAIGRGHELTIQVIRFGASGENSHSASAAFGKSRAPGSSLTLLSVVPGPQDSPVAALNKAAAAALGRVFILGGGTSEAIAALVERFSAEPRLGAACVDRSSSAGTPRERAGSAPDVLAPGLAVRGDLWMALDGLDDSFVSIDWALHEFFVRARAIGFAAPSRIDRLDGPGSKVDVSEDCRRIRGRVRLAPDRSGDRARHPKTPIQPDQLTIYTAITNRYDTLKPQLPGAVGGSPLIAFLDAETAAQHEGRMRGWQSNSVRFPDIGARRASRYFKANAHLALPQSRYSLWMDASVSLVAPFSAAQLAETFLTDCDLCVFRHHVRTSIHEEAEACKALGLDAPEVIDRQIDRYRRGGFPDDAGLAELPIILRRHSRSVEAFNEAWWAEIAAGSWRDQLSFDYVAWKTGFRYATFPLSLVIPNGLFVKFRR